MSTFLDYLLTAIPLGMTFLYGCTGEIITEKAGHLNLGIPGIMCMGGACGCMALKILGKTALPPAVIVIIAILCAFLGGVLMGLIYSLLTVTLRANQNVTGLAITTFGIGFGNFFGGSITKLFGEGGSLSVKVCSDYFKTTLPFSDSLGAFGKIFFSYQNQ